jgi:hypothetical protein
MQELPLQMTELPFQMAKLGFQMAKLGFQMPEVPFKVILYDELSGKLKILINLLCFPVNCLVQLSNNLRNLLVRSSSKIDLG